MTLVGEDINRCVVVDSGLQVERALSPPLRVLNPPKVIARLFEKRSFSPCLNSSISKVLIPPFLPHPRSKSEG